MFKRSLLSLVTVLGLSCAAAQASDVDANAGRFAAVRNLWTTCVNSDSVTFVTKMINPMAYGAACKAVYEAGIKNAVTTLSADAHRPVVVGTVALTTATVAAIAYYQGWFAKAKTWVSSKLN